MPETVEYSVGDEIIQVKSWGDISADEWLATSKEVLRIHDEDDVKLVLVDATRQTSIPPVGEIYEFAKFWNPNIIVAVVANKTTIENQKFHQNTALNRGKIIQVFESRDSAIDWLDHHRDPAT